MRRAFVIVSALALFALPSSAARVSRRPSRPVYAAPRPQYEMVYSSGMVSYETKDFGQVVLNMNNAIKMNPVESANPIRLEHSMGPYLPYYYLGVALYELGPSNPANYADAVRALRESERQGSVQRFPALYRDLQVRTTSAQFKSVIGNRPRYDQVEARKPGPINAMFDSVAAPLNDFALGHPDVANVVAAAAGKVHIGASSDESEKAIRQAEADRLARESADLARSNLKRQIEKRIQAGRDLALLSKGATAQPAADAARELESAINRSALLSPNLSTDELQSVLDGLEAAIVKTRDAMPKTQGAPPPVLFDATASFFAGDYARAVKILDGVTFDDARATVQALMVRAAARHALYLSGGEKDRTLLDRATEDVKLCHQLDPKATPPDAFSPKFREFFSGS